MFQRFLQEKLAILCLVANTEYILLVLDGHVLTCSKMLNKHWSLGYNFREEIKTLWGGEILYIYIFYVTSVLQ